MLSLQLCNIKRSYSCTAFLLRITWSHPEVIKSLNIVFFSCEASRRITLRKRSTRQCSLDKRKFEFMFSVPISCATVCVYQHPLASDIICRLPVRPTYEVHLRKKITPKSKTFFENIPWWSFEMFQLIQLIIWQGSSENHFKVSW